MSEINLLEPFLDQGIKNTNFFEGRLLTAGDLREQQEANRTRHRQSGRAIGAGIVEGLEVTVEKDGSDGTPPAVRISPGLAVNSRGRVLELPDSYITLKLTRTLEDTGLSDTKLFDNCTLPPSTEKLPNGVGVYILVMSPASGYRERAPKSGLGDNGIVRGCGNRYAVEGMQFRLVPFDPLKLSSTPEKMLNLLKGKNNDGLLSFDKPAQKSETARLSRLRNIMAHLCFGTEELEGFAADPFKLENGRSAYLKYGALDELRSIKGCLSGCDVPLALIYWTLDGIAFLDMWSVRRRPYELTPSSKWPIISPRRPAESEAMFFQFQEQIELIIRLCKSQSQLASVEAAKYFTYLPAAGMIPVTISSIKEYHKEKAGKIPVGLTGTNRGFDYRTFLANITFREPVFIEGTKVNHIINDSFMYRPVDTGRKEMVWLYLCRENVESIIEDINPALQPYMILTNGHMPFYGEARYDLSSWDYSNYT